MCVSLRQLMPAELVALERGHVPDDMPPPVSATAWPPTAVIRRATKRIAESGPASWWCPMLVVRTVDGVAVGGCAFKGPPVDGRVEILYGVAEECRRAGLASIAVGQLTALARNRGAREVLAEIRADNIGSARTVQRCGFRRTGTCVASDGVAVTHWVCDLR